MQPIASPAVGVIMPFRPPPLSAAGGGGAAAAAAAGAAAASIPPPAAAAAAGNTPPNYQECCICWEPSPSHSGLACPSGHFHCLTCLDGWVKSQAEPQHLRVYGGKIPCAWRGGNNKAIMERCHNRWEQREVLPLVGERTKATYVDAVLGVMTALIEGGRPDDGGSSCSGNSMMERSWSMRPWVEQADEDSDDEEEVVTSARYVVEEVLNLRCPACKAVFAVSSSSSSSSHSSSGNCHRLSDWGLSKPSFPLLPLSPINLSPLLSSLTRTSMPVQPSPVLVVVWVYVASVSKAILVVPKKLTSMS